MLTKFQSKKYWGENSLGDLGADGGNNIAINIIQIERVIMWLRMRVRVKV